MLPGGRCTIVNPDFCDESLDIVEPAVEFGSDRWKLVGVVVACCREGVPGIADAAGEFGIDVFGQARQLCSRRRVLDSRRDTCPALVEGDLQRLAAEDR